MKKIISKITAVCAAMTFAVASIGITTNASGSADYSLHYHRYANNNVTKQTFDLGTAERAGLVTATNHCTELTYATIKTTAEAFCNAPTGSRYYTIAIFENTTTGWKTDTGSYPYITTQSEIRNIVELQYNSSSYYTQTAKGTTNSY